MNINLANQEVQILVEVLDRELLYKINESGCADEYEEDIRAFIMLLRKIGYESLADCHLTQFEEEMEELRNE